MSASLASTPEEAQKTLRICQWNCRELRSHYYSLVEASQRDSIDVFLLQETLLPEDATVTLPGFATFHWPRTDRAGGDLTILARCWLDCRLLRQPLHCGDRVEVQAYTIHLSNRSPTLYNIYRPTIADLQLDELFGLATSEFVLDMGDYNAHHPRLESHAHPTPRGVPYTRLSLTLRRYSFSMTLAYPHISTKVAST